MRRQKTIAKKQPRPRRLQHHRHTGRLIHHQYTSFHWLAVIIGLVGALMIGVGMMAKATADTLTVYARNPAPLPTIPAVITSPADKTMIKTPHLQVSGTCEVASPANIVTILDNGQIAGSAPCRDDGTFSLTIMLEPGQHTLIARTYTITEGVGPDSQPVTVYREVDAGPDTGTDTGGAPQTPAGGQPGGDGGGHPTIGEPLKVTVDRPFITFGPGKDAVWAGTITGGRPPYRVSIDWNDGDSDEYTISEAGEQSFRHRYEDMWPHLVTVQVTDQTGQTVIQQSAAVTPYLPPATTAPKQPWDGSVLIGLYGAYLLVLAVFGALWALTHPSYAPVPVPARRPPTKYNAQTDRTR